MNIETIEREAKLFEAGSYPDRGIEITEEDLDRIAASTSEAPVRVEHSDTPFDGALGVLKSVYRKGKELFGKLCFTQAAWELIKLSDAKRLSVALRKDKSGIAEVSLVKHPRIADAAVFSAGETVQLGECEFVVSEPEFSTNEPDPELMRLKHNLIEKEVDTAIDQLKRAGKLAPAAEIFARAILREGESSLITFGTGPMPVSQVFRWFLESQPKVIEFSELAPAADDSFDEPDLFCKLGVTTAQVEKHRAR